MESSQSASAPHRFNLAAILSVGLLLIFWQIASFLLPEFIVPGLQLIGLEFVKMFEEGTLVSDSALNSDSRRTKELYTPPLKRGFFS